MSRRLLTMTIALGWAIVLTGCSGGAKDKTEKKPEDKETSAASKSNAVAAVEIDESLSPREQFEALKKQADAPGFSFMPSFGPADAGDKAKSGSSTSKVAKKPGPRAAPGPGGPKMTKEQMVAARKKIGLTPEKMKEIRAQMEKAKAEAAKKGQKVIGMSFSSRPPADRFIPKAIEIAEKNPKDEVAIECLAWAAEKDRRGKFSGEIIGLVKKNHLDDPRVGTVCIALGQSDSVAGEELLRTVISEGKSDDAVGMSMLALAQVVNQKGIALFSKDKEKSEQLTKEADELYMTVSEKYGSVKTPNGKTLGQIVDPLLFEARHLQVGRTAPDIVGEDLHGVEFKLSDYNGKVVLLDFWGHW